jgi:hypothetical protein
MVFCGYIVCHPLLYAIHFVIFISGISPEGEETFMI